MIDDQACTDDEGSESEEEESPTSGRPANYHQNLWLGPPLFTQYPNTGINMPMPAVPLKREHSASLNELGGQDMPLPKQYLDTFPFPSGDLNIQDLGKGLAEPSPAPQLYNLGTANLGVPPPMYNPNLLPVMQPYSNERAIPNTTISTPDRGISGGHELQDSPRSLSETSTGQDSAGSQDFYDNQLPSQTYQLQEPYVLQQPQMQYPQYQGIPQQQLQQEQQIHQQQDIQSQHHQPQLQASNEQEAWYASLMQFQQPTAIPESQQVYRENSAFDALPDLNITANWMIKPDDYGLIMPSDRLPLWQ